MVFLKSLILKVQSMSKTKTATAGQYLPQWLFLSKTIGSMQHADKLNNMCRTFNLF